jgi:predicted type IV restriction endonuclease
MAFKKKLSSKSVEILKEAVAPVPAKETKKIAFPEGTKYVRDGQTWIVKRAFVDGSADMREVQSTLDGNVEVMLLSTMFLDGVKPLE